MATGDITACRILATGWEAEVDIEGLSTGGTYAMDGSGATLTDTATAKVVFTVVSEGYSAAGVLGTKTRTVYGTRARQKAYPNHAAAEEAVAEGTLTVTLALSDYIYDDDNTGAGKSGTAPTVTLGAGFYTQGGTPTNAATALTVTNNSTQDYPTVIARWAVVPYQRFTTTFELEAVAFHRFAEYGRPVACVKFTATDGTNTVETFATAMVKSTAADKLPCYRATISASSFIDNAVVTCNFMAYPWVGDADSVRDSSTGTANTLDLGPLPLLADSDDDYGVTLACVNTSTGNDGTGAASPTYATANAAPYATIRAALAGIQTYNNANLSRNNANAGVIYLQSDDHSWGNGTGSATTSDVWVTVTRAPNVAKASAKIVGAPNASVVTALCRVHDLTVVPTGFVFAGAAGRALWLSNVDNQPATQLATQTAQGYAVTYNTFCTAGTLDFPWGNYSTANLAALVRGCTATSARGLATTPTYMPRVTLTTTVTHSASGGQIGACGADNTLTAYCRSYNAPSGPVLTDDQASHTAVVCCLIEQLSTTGGNATAHGNSTAGSTVTNKLVWHVTVAGERTLMAYNTDPAHPHTVTGLSLKFGSFQWLCTKHDVFATDGSLTQAWSVLYGVGWRGNNSEDVDNNFKANYPGLGSTYNTVAGYVDDQSRTTSGTGHGNYHTTAASVLRGKITAAADVVIPYDLTGRPYAAGGPAGAFTVGGYRLWGY